MTDLRQGVSPFQHRLLDHMEEQAAIALAEGPYDHGSFDDRIMVALGYGRIAQKTPRLDQKCEMLIATAALLMDCGEEIALLLKDRG